MTKEEIIDLARRCYRKVFETCMEEPGFSTTDCPEGANGLSDIVLNVILSEFPATKECSSGVYLDAHAVVNGYKNYGDGYADVSLGITADDDFFIAKAVKDEELVVKIMRK